MFPSNNLLALVRAYDLFTPDVKSEEEFRMQSVLFLTDLEPYIKPVRCLFEGYDRKCKHLQNRFDALLSVAFDVGLDVLQSTSLPDLVMRDAPKQQVITAINSIPTFSGTMRQDIVLQMQRYGYPSLSRRQAEAELYCGRIYFSIGRSPDPVTGDIAYRPHVLHPFLRFLYCAPT